MIEWILKKLGKLPKVGEQWIWDNGDPFGDKYHPVQILEIKNGWVRYDMQVYKNNRIKIWQFVLWYKKYNKDNQC